jgi:hypothetical protein
MLRRFIFAAALLMATAVPIESAHAGEIVSLSLHIPSTAAGTADQWYIAEPLTGKWQIKEVKFAPATAVAAAATDYTTVTISTNDSTASTTWTDIASFNTNSGATALVIGTTLDLTLTAGAGLFISEGYQIKVGKAETASGDILDGTFTFFLEKVPR